VGILMNIECLDWEILMGVLTVAMNGEIVHKLFITISTKILGISDDIKSIFSQFMMQLTRCEFYEQ